MKPPKGSFLLKNIEQFANKTNQTVAKFYFLKDDFDDLRPGRCRHKKNGEIGDPGSQKILWIQVKIQIILTEEHFHKKKMALSVLITLFRS